MREKQKIAPISAELSIESFDPASSFHNVVRILVNAAVIYNFVRAESLRHLVRLAPTPLFRRVALVLRQWCAGELSGNSGAS